ncbi:MAG: hypothetical protein MSG64_17315 [Pyrinomonadaceae bacterium MAG19_C2-C3]|nr:hypothetical protein [Pyrinomonadaceae bacterium MAG19_C2-C3]
MSDRLKPVHKPSRGIDCYNVHARLFKLKPVHKSSRSDKLNLAVRFNARNDEISRRLSRQRQLTPMRRIQSSLTRRRFYFDAFRALKRTAKFTPPLTR